MTVKCYYQGKCSLRNNNATCKQGGCSLNDLAIITENIKRFNPSRKDKGQLKMREKFNKTSGFLNIDSKVWMDLYDHLLQRNDIPDIKKQRLRKNKQRIADAYTKIEGEWWKHGWKTKLRIFWSSKIGYEIKQEIKAVDIVLSDLRYLQEKVKK